MERYGPYRCLKPLGAGGMGAVYLAEHESTGARYALKVLAGALDPEDELRFAREAQAMAAAGGHPNVARVHTLDRQGARAYMVLELVEGGDLGELLAERAPLPPYEAVELVVGVARGVHHAHERGVLHRDLKPANVLLDGDGRPKVTDFGLAKLSGADTLTQSGEVLGTPVYMAPEQARGEVGSYDARTDVFGLGGVLYACLTGQAPAAGRGGLQATLLAVTQELPPPPSTRNPAVEPWLDALCLRALAKERSERFASAEEFADALERGAGARRKERTLPWSPGACLLPGLLALGAVLAWVPSQSATRPGGTPPGTPWLSSTPRAEAADLARLATECARRAEPAGAPELIAAWEAALAAAEEEGAAEQAAQYRLELVRACARRGHPERALEAAAPLLTHARHGYEARYRSGQACQLLCRGEQAAAHFRELANCDDAAWRSLGRAAGLRFVPVASADLQSPGEPGRRYGAQLVAALQEVPQGGIPGQLARRALASYSQERGVFEPLLSAQPDDALLLVGWVGQRLGSGREANESGLLELERLLRRAEALCAPRRPASLTLHEANLHLLRGDVAGALRLLEAHLQRDPETSVLRLALGSAHEVAGDLLAAQEAWSQLDPEAPLVGQAILMQPLGRRLRLLHAAGYPAGLGLELRPAMGELLSDWRAELPEASRDAAEALILRCARGYPWSGLEPGLRELTQLPGPAVRLLAAELALARGRLGAARTWLAEARSEAPLRADLLALLTGQAIDPGHRPGEPASAALLRAARALQRSEFSLARAALQEVPADAPGWVLRRALDYDLPASLALGRARVRAEELAKTFYLHPLAHFMRQQEGCLTALGQGDTEEFLRRFVEFVICLPLLEEPLPYSGACLLLELGSEDLRKRFDPNSPALWCTRAQAVARGSVPRERALRHRLDQLEGLRLMNRVPPRPQVLPEPEAAALASRVARLLLPLDRSTLSDAIRARYLQVFGRELR